MNRFEEYGLKVVGANLLGESDRVRHNSVAIAAAAVRLAEEGRRTRLRG